MHTIRSDRPLEARLSATLEIVLCVTKAQGVEYFVAGATARELVLTHVFGLDTGVATKDIDFAVVTDSWDAFEELKRALIATAAFVPHEKRQERLLPADSSAAYPIDLIPFGQVEHAPAQIAWPPDMEVIMNVAGYAEVSKAALRVEIAPDVSAKVASLPGLAILKLFAWLDRGLADSKDARDLLLMLRRYHEAGNQDRLYEGRFAVLEAAGYDLERAGAWLLGEDAGRIAVEGTCQGLLEALENSSIRERLVTHMAAGLRGNDDALTYASVLLTDLIGGLRSG